MSKVSEQFKQEVSAVCERYGAKLHIGEHYDREEQYCGDSYWIIVDGELLQLSDLLQDE